jgi:AAA+ superfamily predicted ATPase
MKSMTKEEYQALKRKPVKDWTHEECVRADLLVKDATINKLKIILEDMEMPHVFKNWAILVVKFHFGSAETDAMLITLGAYPDWM